MSLHGEAEQKEYQAAGHVSMSLEQLVLIILYRSYKLYPLLLQYDKKSAYTVSKELQATGVH